MKPKIKESFYFTAIIAIFTLCSYLLYETNRIYKLVGAGAEMSRTAEKHERVIGNQNNILILGDSLAFGVGASNSGNSFAGLISRNFPDKSIKNNSVIGETVSSLENSIDQKATDDYETIYIIVGGNDIMRLHINIFQSKRSLEKLIRNVSSRADKVVLVTTGDFSNVSLSPKIMQKVFEARANTLRNSALALESEFDNFNYVDFHTVSFKKSEYKQLEAADGYHLNDEGIKKLVTVMLTDKY